MSFHSLLQSASVTELFQARIEQFQDLLNDFVAEPTESNRAKTSEVIFRRVWSNAIHPYDALREIRKKRSPYRRTMPGKLTFSVAESFALSVAMAATATINGQGVVQHRDERAERAYLDFIRR